jgi:hypothetical protein
MNLTTGTLMAGVFALCTALFWGTYGPLLQRGHHFMGTEGRMRPFICVGIAYLLVAIIGPIVAMYTLGIDRGEGLFHGWTFRGILWSTIAGAVGALGAFTLLVALGAGGSTGPLFIMPIVFGCAPVVSTLTSMYMNNAFNRMSPFFAAGLILVAAGAVTILITAPRPLKSHPPGAHGAHDAPPIQAESAETTKSEENPPPSTGP